MVYKKLKLDEISHEMMIFSSKLNLIQPFPMVPSPPSLRAVASQILRWAHHRKCQDHEGPWSS